MVGPQGKREAAIHLQDKFGVSERRSCRAMELSRTTKRYLPKENEQNKYIAARLCKLAEKKQRFGSPRLHQLLLREGLKINHKRTERIYRLEKLALRRRTKRKRYKSLKRTPLTNPIAPNQCWAMDFVSDQLSSGMCFRGLTIIDIYTRECPHIEVARSLPAVRVVQALERLKLERGLPDTIVLDNGPEMISLILDKWAYDNGVKLHFITPGKPTENAFVESFNGTFRDECLNLQWFSTLEDARDKIAKWCKEYNEDNPHSSLGYLTPKEFAKKLVV